MEQQVIIYNELWRVRERIKEEEKARTGRKPKVCSDESLQSMVELMPTKLSELESVQGLGRTFIDNYGEPFVEVLKKYQKDDTCTTVGLSDSTGNILKELSNKLVNINKRNRLLYMPRLNSKFAVDLYSVGEKCVLDILGKTTKITVCDKRKDGESKEIEALYKKLVQLNREVNKDIRDKGQNDLYLAYPFVIGCLPNENFSVRAPLALFPVQIEKQSDTIKVSGDDSRDIVYNTTLILAYRKFNNINKELPDESLDSYDGKQFIDDVIAYYAQCDLNLRYEQQSFQPCKDYMAKDFPKFKQGEMHLVRSAVLGKFPTRANAIQRDFDAILRDKVLNPLLSDLVGNNDASDFYADQDSEDASNVDVSEHDLVYINDLNSSQEVILSVIDNEDELVVQGPPGTGKSQTITSLISDFVCGGKSVLMVSEKKTALDVVYSRLGDLSRFALLIDDVGNKELFYQQLQQMMDIKGLGNQKINLNPLSDQIDQAVKSLKDISDQMYCMGQAHVEPYRYYQEFISKNGELNGSLAILGRDNKVLEQDFPAFMKSYETFCDESLGENVMRFNELKTSYPWLDSMRKDLTNRDQLELAQRLKQLLEVVQSWRERNFIMRFLTRGKVKSAASQIIHDYFTDDQKELTQVMCDSPDEVQNGIQDYDLYQSLEPIYERLSHAEQEYANTLAALKRDGDSIASSNNKLYLSILREHIDQFEASHRTLLTDINQFETIVRRIGETMQKKQQATRQLMADILTQSIGMMSKSKKYKEMLRVIESKRKWSVSKFIDKFNFELFNNIRIWLLTPEVVSDILPLQTGLFDLLVFDEASQMYVERGIPSILRAKKVVVAGDHKQLRPSSLGAGRTDTDSDSEDEAEEKESSAALEEESLLDLARFKYRDIMLNFHYRAQYEELIAFSNYAFYQGKLRVSPNAVDPEKPPIEVHRIENACWENRSNRAEAQYIVGLLKAFFKERQHEESVGVITFNSSQRDLVEDLIDEEVARDAQFGQAVQTETGRRKNGEDIGLFIKNIESVQGDERDVIIFSIGYAKNEDGKLVRNFGWLNQRGGGNRLNVAISRAKKKVHIVTSFNPSELQVDDMKNDGPRLLRKYLEYADAVSSKNSELARHILLSMSNEPHDLNQQENDEFIDHVCSTLKSKGFDVDVNVGIGGYSIDLAIRKNGKYMLGIECDGNLYTTSPSTRDRDYHRRKYLQARGWKMYRIWSSNWWRDPDHEVECISKLVSSDR